jgi:hypothetical protein
VACQRKPNQPQMLAEIEMLLVLCRYWAWSRKPKESGRLSD